jgi:hypothetical protein
MTKEEVIALPTEVFKKARINRALGWPSVRSINGRPTWIVSTLTVGGG